MVVPVLAGNTGVTSSEEGAPVKDAATRKREKKQRLRKNLEKLNFLGDFLDFFPCEGR